MAIVFLRFKEAQRRGGKGRSSTHEDIVKGLFVPPVVLGPRTRGYPEHEVEAINSARLAGQCEDEIRDLVRRLVAARKLTS